ncbi:flavodoxin family protein [Aquabacterium sp.]|uniref:flavodoxin family protein n=1 Tax=Aquabacterium sp. TaxID=1872578 RepID=UPI002CF375A8|nr:flavodoxin family protein [Aquabacterium sp.]HSW03083.1 flavodoxin family protein [Aquabacterium sp.]
MANDVRTGQAPGPLQRDEFGRRFRQAFADPAFNATRSELDRVETVAWRAYEQGNKSPVTRRAGPGFADPDYELSVDWLATHEALAGAQARHDDAAAGSRVLLICGSPRNDGSCPGENSKSFRLVGIAQQALQQDGFEVDLLDLSQMTSDYGRRIHPCKGCVSTAMPLCHWPCSCYPNHAMNQAGDWMAEIYERWVAAHGVLIVTPVHWYQVPSVLKLMIDRLVCADGGNPDPTSTGGKDPARAKALELAGWPYPKHLAGRAYGVIVHGDVGGTEATRRALCDWLDWMGLIDAGEQARLDRFIGYYQPYATSHQALDGDDALQQEVRNAAASLAHVVGELRAGRQTAPDLLLRRPRRK